MKYLHWIRSLAGGAGVMAVETSLKLRQLGIDCYVIEMDKNYSTEWGTEKRSEELRIICKNWLIQCSDKNKVDELIIKLNVDVIIYHIWHQNDSKRWTSDKKKLHIAWIHTSGFYDVKNYDKYLFVSFSQINSLKNSPEIEKFRVIKNGINLEKIRKIRRKPRSEIFRICRASGLTTEKVGASFLSLLKEMKKENYEFIIIGSGEGKEIINSYLIKHKIRNVFLLGDLMYKDVIGYYKSSDLVLYLTGNHQENHSVTLLEAQACGTPTICENKGGLPEQILQRKSGIICNSIPEIIENIKMLMTNPIKLNNLSSNAKKISKFYNIKDTINEIQDIIIYESINKR